MSKIRQYFSTLELIRGFLSALFGSLFIYLEYFNLSSPLANTILALLSLYLLLKNGIQVWFFYGAFTSLFWFWWVSMSLIQYDLIWLIPLEIIFLMLIYGTIFAFFAWISHQSCSVFIQLLLKSLVLLGISYIHPFSFDWLKPELMFTDTPFGILKWQFGVILLSLSATIWRKRVLYLFCVFFAYQPITASIEEVPKDIMLVTTQTGVKDKWNKTLQKTQFNKIFQAIDTAIDANKTLIIFPESVFPLYLKRTPKVYTPLLEKSKQIDIIVGGLSWKNKHPYNSTYFFHQNKVTIADKVVLVPFGESNPLPQFLSDWVNEVFYDGAVDYLPSEEVTDFNISGKLYRNAICFEATSEKLYEGSPKNMIVISNNGWFTPSIEPNLQKILLRYYHKKYHTNIYHSTNMSPSYVILNEHND